MNKTNIGQKTYVCTLYIFLYKFIVFYMHITHVGTTKGQIISEAIFLGFNYSKKRTKYSLKFALATRAEVFCSFLEELKKQKNSSDII